MPAAVMSVRPGVGDLLHIGFAEAWLDIYLVKDLDESSLLLISSSCRC